MLNSKLFDVIENSANPLGYEVVDIECSQDGLVRVFIDVLDEKREINLNDCELVTKQLMYLLPVENLSFERLEVSSPGIDRKLTKLKHFERFLGCKVRIKLKSALSGRKVFEGLLMTCNENKLNKIIEDWHVSKINDEKVFCLEFEDTSDRKKYLDFKLDDLDQARLVTDVSFKRRSS